MSHFFAKVFKLRTYKLCSIVSEDYFRDTKSCEDVLTDEENGLLGSDGLDRLYLDPLVEMINYHNYVIP